jgi:uncharacterized protein (TIGR03435 family)
MIGLPHGARFKNDACGARDALGLKLEARKVPLEKITIDSIEKMPTEN